MQHILPLTSNKELNVDNALALGSLDNLFAAWATWMEVMLIVTLHRRRRPTLASSMSRLVFSMVLEALFSHADLLWHSSLHYFVDL